MSNVDDLLRDRRVIDAQLRKEAIEALKQVSDGYIAIYGNPQGIHQMGEDLCQVIAQQKGGPGGWDALLRHLIKISG